MRRGFLWIQSSCLVYCCVTTHLSRFLSSSSSSVVFGCLQFVFLLHTHHLIHETHTWHQITTPCRYPHVRPRKWWWGDNSLWKRFSYTALFICIGWSAEFFQAWNILGQSFSYSESGKIMPTRWRGHVKEFRNKHPWAGYPCLVAPYLIHTSLTIMK